MTPPGPICVIFNPAAGRGVAARTLPVIQERMKDQLILRPTDRAGHAVELACRAAEEGFPVVVAAGGDGTVHEVANGVLTADRRDTIFSIWPMGSGDDYAHALGLKPWWKKKSGLPPKGVRQVDVGRITSHGKSAFFVNCLGIGFNGAVTHESRHIHWLSGMPLYSLATWRALWRHFEQPKLRVCFDDLVREVPTLALSVNLGPREGTFPVTPAACLDDGLFDAVQAGPLTRWQTMRLLPRMATGTLRAHERLWLGRCRRVTIESPVPLRIHADGEFYCQPEEMVANLQIELLPRRLRVLTDSQKSV